MHPKVCTLDRLLQLRREARAAGRRVVQCHGCFDIVHPGHIRHLQFARAQGDILLVSVSSDSHVHKGVNRPLIPDDLRADSLAALECVDWVYINPFPTAAELLGQLQPDLYVKGREYERNNDTRFLAERDIVERGGGRVIFSSDDIVFSSTALIEQLESQHAFDHEKLRRLRERAGLGGPALHQIVSRFRDLRCLVVGDYILDEYQFCDPAGVAGEAPMMSLRAIARRAYDGAAVVIALHLAGLGARPVLFTALAEDEVGRGVKLRLASAGVEAHSPCPRPATVCKRRFLVEQAKLFKVDEGQSAPLDSHSQRLLADRIIAAADGADAAILADFGYGLISPGLLDRILPELRRKVPVISADVSGSQASLLAFRGVDLLCPTERELRETLHDSSSGLGAVAYRLLDATAARSAIVTLGREGLVTFEPPQRQAVGERLRSEYIPALAAHAVDPLGCGDALLAAATAALAAGSSLPGAALLGALAAAAEVQFLGNQPLDDDRLLREIDRLDASTPLRLAS